MSSSSSDDDNDHAMYLEYLKKKRHSDLKDDYKTSRNDTRRTHLSSTYRNGKL